MEYVLHLYIYLLTAVCVLYFITCILINNFYIDRQDDKGKYPPVVKIYRNDEIIPCNNFINLSFSRLENTAPHFEQQGTPLDCTTSVISSDKAILNEINCNKENSYCGLENIYSIGRSSSDSHHSSLEIMKTQNTRKSSNDKVRNSKEFSNQKVRNSKEFSNEKVRNSKEISNERVRNCKEFSNDKVRNSKEISNEKVRNSKEFSNEKVRNSKEFSNEKVRNSKEFSIEKVRNSKECCKSRKQSIKHITSCKVGNNSSKDLKHVCFLNQSSTNIENDSGRKKSNLNMVEVNVEKELKSHYPTCSTKCENHHPDKDIDVSIVSTTNRTIKLPVGNKRKCSSNSKNTDKLQGSTKMVKSNYSNNENMNMTQSEESQMRAIEFDNKINELKKRCRNLVTDADFSAELEKIGRGKANKINADISECVKECKELAAKHNSRDASLERYNSNCDSYKYYRKRKSNVKAIDKINAEIRDCGKECKELVDKRNSRDASLERYSANDESYKNYSKLRSDIKASKLQWNDKEGEETVENSRSRLTERSICNPNSDSTNKGQRNAQENDFDVPLEKANNSNVPVKESILSKLTSKAFWKCFLTNTDSESENSSDNNSSKRRKDERVTESNASIEMNLPSSRLELAKNRREQIKYLKLSSIRDRAQSAVDKQNADPVIKSDYSDQMRNIIPPNSVDTSVSTEMGTVSYGTQKLMCQRKPKLDFISESDTSVEMSTHYKPKAKGTCKTDVIPDSEISDGFKSRKIDQMEYTASEFSLELTRLCNTCNELINEEPFSLEEPLKTSTPKHNRRETKLKAKHNETGPGLKMVDNNLNKTVITKQKFEEDLKDLRKKYFINEVNKDVDTNSGVLTMSKGNQNKCVCTVVQKHISTSTSIIPYPNLQPQNNVNANQIQAICSTIVSKRTESWMQTDPITNQLSSNQCASELNNEPNMPAFRPEYNEKYPCTQKGLHEIFDSVLAMHTQAEECCRLETKPTANECCKMTKISESKIKRPKNSSKSHTISLKIKNKGSSTTTTKELGAGHSNKIRLRIVTKPKRKKHSDSPCNNLRITECIPEKDEEQCYVPKVMQSCKADSPFRRSVSDSRSKPCPCARSLQSRTPYKCKPDNKSVLEILSEKVENCLERAKNLIQEPPKKNVCEYSRRRSESPRSRTSMYYDRRSRSRSPKLAMKHIYLPDRDEIAAKLYNKQHNIRPVTCPYVQYGSSGMGLSETSRSNSSSNAGACHSRTPKPTNHYCRC